MDNETESLKEITLELLRLLLIDGSASVTKDNETLCVSIETSQSGALIGYHGEGLVSIQLILNILMHKKTGDWQRVVVNIGDYRQKREEYLKNLALMAASKAKNTKQPSILTGLSSFERRIVHMVLAEDKEIESVSEGEGAGRHLVVKLKT